MKRRWFRKVETETPSRTANAIHIVCSVFNGQAYFAEFVQSVQSQTVGNWMMWVRDDGSSDDSVRLLQQLSASDERIHVLDGDGSLVAGRGKLSASTNAAVNANLGVVASFNRVLQQLPIDARYIMFADQDDVWLPQKIEYTLSAMMLGEQHSGGPLLVHTDAHVVSEQLSLVAESFWAFAHINPEATSLQQLITRNVVTGATMMINRALRERVGDIPAAAAMHDWYLACVASAFGNLIAVTTPTMQYRQHSANAIGASVPGSAATAVALPGAAVRAFRQTARVKRDIDAASRQAGALLTQFGDALNASDRAFLAEYAAIANHTFLRRKLDIARLHLHREDGWLKNAGLLLRA